MIMNRNDTCSVSIMLVLLNALWKDMHDNCNNIMDAKSVQGALTDCAKSSQRALSVIT